MAQLASAVQPVKMKMRITRFDVAEEPLWEPVRSAIEVGGPG